MYEIKITNGELNKLSIVGDLNTICAEVTAAFKNDAMFCESEDDEGDALLKMLQALIEEFDE